MRRLPPSVGGPARGLDPEAGRARSPEDPARGGRRLLLLALGGTCVGLGLLGLALPVLPTTPFLLLALWAFARSSRRFHDWLYHHPRFGPRLRLWDQHRVIPPGAKVAAVSTMAASLAGLILLSRAPWYSIAAAAALMAYGAWFILTKPSRVDACSGPGRRLRPAPLRHPRRSIAPRACGEAGPALQAPGMSRTPRRRPLSSVSHGAAAVASLGATAALYVAAGIGSLDLALPALAALAALSALLGWEDNRPGVLLVVLLSLVCFPVSGVFVAISHAVLAREARVRERLVRRMEGLTAPRPARDAPAEGAPGPLAPPPPAP